MMPLRESKQQLKQEVHDAMRLYLGQHPEQCFRVALDSVDLILSRSTSLALVEWRERLADLNKSALSLAVAEPVSASHAKALPKPKRKVRK